MTDTSSTAEHIWKTDSNGRIDEFALNIEDETTGHNGPACTACELSFCAPCASWAWTIPCPGPAPAGHEWDWTGDGGFQPPRVPNLRIKS